MPHIIGCKKDKAEEWYKAGDGLGAGIVKQSNFLRRKGKSSNEVPAAKTASAGGVGTGMY